MNRWFCVVLLAAACTKKVNTCTSDADCKNPEYPFCDVNGEYPASGGDKNVCTVVPANCPIDRCGCTPGAALACSADQLTVCAADGKSTTTEVCALGCSSDGTRCVIFDPSNGLGGPLAMAAMEQDVVLPPGARVDTDLGKIEDPSGNAVAVASVLVPQTGGPMIRAFVARSFVMDDVTTLGTNALAFVAHGSITIRGALDASANGVTAGPGAQEPPAACVGTSTVSHTCAQGQPFACSDGGGGGGNAVMGGAGGTASSTTGLPGAAVSSSTALLGGCRGGNVDSIGGGGGGGAVQLVSLAEVDFSNSGLVDVGGGGGRSSAGGGSGGLVIIEAPRVRFLAPSTGITANGGAGGGCGMNGEDGSPSVATAVGPQCPPQSAGDGGTEAGTPGSGTVCSSSCPFGEYGGGGGAVGRARIATMTGEIEGSPILSVAVTKQTLAVH